MKVIQSFRQMQQFSCNGFDLFISYEIVLSSNITPHLFFLAYIGGNCYSLFHIYSNCLLEIKIMFVIMEHSCYYSFKEKCFCNVFFKCWKSTPTHVYADVLVPIVGELLLVKPEPMND